MLHLEHPLDSFGGFDDSAEAATWHSEVQAMLASWCCTADPRFKRVAGIVPYVLPPLEGHERQAWSGGEARKVEWVGRALAETYDASGDVDMGQDMRRAFPPARKK